MTSEHKTNGLVQNCSNSGLLEIVLLSLELTLKQLGIFFNVIIFSNVVHHKCTIFIWNWSNAMNV